MLLTYRDCGCGCGGRTQYTYLRGHRPPIATNDKGERRCCECHEWKPETAEFFPRCGKRGFGKLCKPCHVYRGSINQKKRLVNPKVRAKMRARWRKEVRERRKLDPQKMRDIQHRSNQKLRAQVVAAYGGSCACCGERELPFLTLEHVNGDGKEHRKRVGTGYRIWLDLRARNWPQEGYSILCWNCHMATCRGRKCPHKAG